MAKYDERAPLRAADVIMAVRAAYRLGVLDVLLRSKRLHPEIRARIEAERELKLIDLRSAGMTEEAFG
jgi:hypothetical protein